MLQNEEAVFLFRFSARDVASQWLDSKKWARLWLKFILSLFINFEKYFCYDHCHNVHRNISRMNMSRFNRGINPWQNKNKNHLFKVLQNIINFVYRKVWFLITKLLRKLINGLYLFIVKKPFTISFLLSLEKKFPNVWPSKGLFYRFILFLSFQFNMNRSIYRLISKWTMKMI